AAIGLARADVVLGATAFGQLGAAVVAYGAHEEVDRLVAFDRERNAAALPRDRGVLHDVGAIRLFDGAPRSNELLLEPMAPQAGFHEGLPMIEERVRDDHPRMRVARAVAEVVLFTAEDVGEESVLVVDHPILRG